MQHGEHNRRIKKPQKIDTFVYQHCKCTGHFPDTVSVQPIEKINYDENSSSRFKKISKDIKLNIKWIKLLNPPFPLELNDNLYQEGNISKMSCFDVFSLL